MSVFKPTKMIYLASPYTHAKKSVMKKRYEQITEIAAVLEEQYPYAFILPITMSHNTAKYSDMFSTGFDDWRLRDLTYLHNCDEIWVVTMDGYMESKGVVAEIGYAIELGIPRVYVYPSKDKDGKYTFRLAKCTGTITLDEKQYAQKD